jgi:hypothetical protein
MMGEGQPKPSPKASPKKQDAPAPPKARALAQRQQQPAGKGPKPIRPFEALFAAAPPEALKAAKGRKPIPLYDIPMAALPPVAAVPVDPALQAGQVPVAPARVDDIPALLIQYSSQMEVDKADDFLANFKQKYFEDPKMIGKLKQKLAQSKLLAGAEPSAVGRIYDAGDYVIKTASICPSDPGAWDYVKELCRQTREGDLIFRVPDTIDGKTNILLPGHFSESIIGITLKYMTREYTPSFAQLYGFEYDPATQTMYTAMEKLIPIKKDIVNIYDAMHLVFQISNALDVGQRRGRYVHNDLHNGNFMGRAIDPNRVKVYTLPDGRYVYCLASYEAVLIDYGFNRLETKKTKLINRANFPPIDDTGRNAKDYYTFNPFYDEFCFIYTTFSNKYRALPNMSYADAYRMEAWLF